MTDLPESGGDGGFKARAGALTLFYLSSPLDRSVLLAMLAEATTDAEVLDEIELPSEAAAIADVFSDSYLVEPADPNLGPGSPVDDETPMKPTPAGREVPLVGATLHRWLAECPAGPVDLGAEAGPVVAPLLTGWCSTVVHELAAGPRSAVEVREAIQTLDLDGIEARLELMSEAGHVEAVPGEQGEPRYAVTDWLRAGIAALAAAARMELRHPPGDTAPIAARDVEAAFLLTLPLLELPEELSGTCSLAVDLDEGVLGSPTGVTVRVAEGRVADCEVRLEQDVDAWAAASASAWLDAVIELDTRQIRSGGQHRVATALLRALHERLFGLPIR